MPTKKSLNCYQIAMLAPAFGVTDRLWSQHYRKEPGASGSGSGQRGAAPSAHGAGPGGGPLPAGRTQDAMYVGGKLLFWPYSRALADVFPELVERAARHLTACECGPTGCPNCVMDRTPRRSRRRRFRLRARPLRDRAAPRIPPRRPPDHRLGP